MIGRISAILGFGLVALGGAQAGAIFSPVQINLGATSVGENTAASNGTPTVAAGNYTSTGGYMNIVYTTVDAGATQPSFTGNSATISGALSSNISKAPFTLGGETSPNTTNSSYYTGGASEPASQTNDTVVVDLGTCSGVVASLSTCGLFNIGQIYTMIQANGEANNWQGITITATGTSADGSTAVTDVLTLTSGTDYRGSNSGTSVTGTQDGSLNTQNTTNNSHTETYGSVTNTLYTYNNILGVPTITGSKYYYQDVQELDLGGAFYGAYLNTVTIASTSATTGNAQRLVFNAMTLDQVPEPGTTALLGLGLGFLGLVRFGRRKV